jgi:hypothetical protein
MKIDYRRADPNYVGFVPDTAFDAIDLFSRFKRLGLSVEQYPETFVWVSRNLDDDEGAKFEEWLCAPQGVDDNAPVFVSDDKIEAERIQLLKEATARDVEEMTISEEDDDEKAPLPDEDVEMVSPSLR